LKEESEEIMLEIKPLQMHKKILYALITLYKKRGRMIKADEIADFVDIYTGTVRNQMRILKSLGLVEAVCGPKGGYKPTVKAYELLGVAKPEEFTKVPVVVNDKLLEDLSVETIELPFISHPDICQARIKLVGNIKNISAEDRIRIGPIPRSGLVIYGKVVGRDDTENMVIIDVEKIATL